MAYPFREWARTLALDAAERGTFLPCVLTAMRTTGWDPKLLPPAPNASVLGLVLTSMYMLCVCYMLVYLPYMYSACSGGSVGDEKKVVRKRQRAALLPRRSAEWRRTGCPS